MREQVQNIEYERSNLFIVARPPGAGQDHAWSTRCSSASRTSSCRSRTPRARRAPARVDGREYHFVDRARSSTRWPARGEFLESAVVHGNCTAPRKPGSATQRAAGNDILLEIDWQGAPQVRKLMPDAVGIFILPPSLDALASG